MLATVALAFAAERPAVPPPEPKGRVIAVYDRDATKAFEARPDVVLSMVNRGITNLTGKPTAAAAWRSLVSLKDIVGLKVYSVPGPRSGTRPAVAAAIVEGLLAAGLPPTNIIVWDKKKEDLIAAGYLDLGKRYGILVEGSADAGYDEKVFYERALVGQLVAGDLEFGRTGETVGRKSFVSKLLTSRITRIINISPLLNHYRAGVAGSFYSLAFGSVDNTLRFEFADRKNFTESIIDIYALEPLWDHVALNVVDGLICQYEGDRVSHLQYSTALNELRFSTDPVALDVLSLMELERQRQANSMANSITNLLDTYQKASVVDLGVSDPGNIQLERMR